ILPAIAPTTISVSATETARRTDSTAAASARPIQRAVISQIFSTALSYAYFKPQSAGGGGSCMQIGSGPTKSSSMAKRTSEPSPGESGLKLPGFRGEPTGPNSAAGPACSPPRCIVFLGIVSLFGDMTYEGARSITGPFLAALGVSATTVGIVAGFGELLGYGSRFLSGYLGDRTGRYWAVTIVGYILNLFAVPLLELAGAWQVAGVLIV